MLPETFNDPVNCTKNMEWENMIDLFKALNSCKTWELVNFPEANEIIRKETGL